MIRFLFWFIFSLFLTLGFSTEGLSQGAANCDDAVAFCGSASLSFPNSTGNTAPSGPNYGTLCTVPYPTWYYMQVGNGGTIQMYLDGGSLDLDFVMWGPYSTPQAGCSTIMSGATPIQSSYDGSHQENMGIGVQGGGGGCAGVGVTTPPAAQAGDYYIVLVTNYSNSSGNLSFDQTNLGQPGAGDTNCAITQPCEVQSVTATATCNGTGATITGVVTAGTGMTTGDLVVSSSCGAGTQSFAVTPANFPNQYNPFNYTINVDVATGQPCTITAQFTDNQLCENTIDVTLPDCSVVPCPTISPTTGTLCVGSNMTITTTDATGTWSTSDANIATVSNAGLVNGIANGTATITYTKDTCITQSIITVTSPVTPTFVNPGPVCDGGTYTLPTTSTQGIAGMWSPAIDNSQTTTYTFTPNVGECGVPTTLTVVVDTITVPTFINPGPICANTPLALPSNSIENVSGTWSPAINNTQTTTYTFTPNTGQCSQPISMEVEVVTDLMPTFSIPSIICENEKIKLPTTSNNGVHGVWTPTYVTSKDSVYNFVVTDTNSCAHNLTVTIPFIPMGSTTDVTATSTLVNEGNTTNLNVTITPYINGIWYSWDPDNTLSCSDCPNPIATPNDATWYIATITTPEGCSYKDSIFIDYRMNCGDVYIPNIFSPNDDGQNDIFRPYGRCAVRAEIYIYDRWGTKIFYTDEIGKGWDGTHNNKLVNTGVYTYRINLSTLYGDNYSFKGTVTLVR